MLNFLLVFVTVLEYFEYSIATFCGNEIIMSLTGQDHTEKLVIYGLACTLFFKPFGSYFIGVIGDKFSRESALKVSFLGMGIITIIFGSLAFFKLSFLMVSIAVLTLRSLSGIFSVGQTMSIKVLYFEGSFKKMPYIGNSINNFCAMLGVLLASHIALHTKFVYENWQWLYLFSGSLNILLFLLVLKNKDLNLNHSKQYSLKLEDFIKLFNKKYAKPIVVSIVNKFFITFTYYFIYVIMKDLLIESFPLEKEHISHVLDYSLRVYVVFGAISGILYHISDTRKLFMSSCNILITFMPITIICLNFGWIYPEIIYAASIIMAFTHTPGFVMIAKGIDLKSRMRISVIGTGIGSCLASLFIMFMSKNLAHKDIYGLRYEWIAFLVVSCLAYAPSIMISRNKTQEIDIDSVEYAK